MNSNITITSLFFVFIFLFGFWLSRSGKPYNGLIFNFHKLIGLAMGIFLIVTVYQAHKAASFSLSEMLSIAVTVIIFIILVAAGGMLSIQAAGGLGNTPALILDTISVIHKVLPYLAILSTAGTLYLLLLQNT